MIVEKLWVKDVEKVREQQSHHWNSGAQASRERGGG